MRALSVDGEDLDVDLVQKRRELLGHLNAVLEVAFEKYSNPRTKNSERQSWGRLIVNAVSCAAGVLKDADIDELKARLETVEEGLKRRP